MLQQFVENRSRREHHKMTEKESLKHTPLYDIHRELGAKMAEFGDWEMPIRYSTIFKEHRAVREAAGLFDVSHMGEIIVEDSNALITLQRLTTNDVSRLAVGGAQYTFMTKRNGTCVDDLIITRIDEKKFMLVVNASNTKKDLRWIQSQSYPSTTTQDVSEQKALLALQGPKARMILARCTPDNVMEIQHFTFKRIVLWSGILADVSRTGYTGEDGFEIMIAEHEAARAWNLLLEKGEARGLVPCGLGARDTLRMEAGFPLYGNDLDEDHTPLEAQLGRFVKLDKEIAFLGKIRLREQQNNASHDLLVGLVLDGRRIARKGFVIQNAAGEVIGEITSGGPAPTLNKNIAMGYVSREYAGIGTELFVVIRNTPILARVVKTPFYLRQKHRKGAKP